MWGRQQSWIVWLALSKFAEFCQNVSSFFSVVFVCEFRFQALTQSYSALRLAYSSKVRYLFFRGAVSFYCKYYK